MKKEIIDLRKRIFNYLKQKALNFEAGISPELTLYRSDQKMFAQREFTPSTIDHLKDSVMKSRAIYLGDFHTFDQNIRNVLRIIKVLLNSNNKCIVALEMVDARYQFYIDTYLDGHLTDLEFLESIDYHESWRFPWSHYKLIFELARENKIKIIGLNTKGNLIQRDKFAADLISHTIKNFDDSQILVLYGELHLSPNKIPGMVKAKHTDMKDIIIHQNLDEVYWKEIEKGQTNKVVAFSDSEYCINSAPPWIKYESMIYWYENLSDDPDFDIHEYIIENGKKIFTDDTHENFLLICKEMIDAIRINFNLEDLENFNLHDHTNLEFIEDKVLEFETINLVRFYNYLFETGQSFKLPDENTFYCSSYSMNRMAYLAGIHIFHHFYKIQNNRVKDTLSGTDSAEQFMLFAMESLFAFFFSKVINPHRKCEMYLDLRTKYSNLENSQTKKLYSVAADILDGEDINRSLADLKLSHIHEVSLHVGHILGEYLYEGIFNQKKAIDIEAGFLKNQLNEFQFNKIRLTLLKGNNYKEHQKRYF